MSNYESIHKRRLWAEELLKSGYSHETKLKTMEYLKRSETLEENGQLAEKLIQLKKNCQTESEFVERLEILIKEHDISSQSRFHWRRLLAEAVSQKKLSEYISEQIVLAVGKAPLGQQENKAKEILKLLDHDITEMDLLYKLNNE